ncbi:MAG: hydrogenase expression/formation protein [Gammaproteobacteria bacterium]|nr:hydrogenase expression/formation protein [Gammaproteobacteria bacterium]MBL6998798.1 hydrogenase expression/formation protein [Gammaproteobacteria bacterium]
MKTPLNLPIEIAAPSTGMAQAVLHELAGHLQQLIESGKTEVIDLTSLPMSSSDKQQLETQLGKGEVDITLTTIGESRIFETAYSGIWWIRHYTADQHLIAELIEICSVPQIIKSHPADMQQALSRLKNTH